MIINQDAKDAIERMNRGRRVGEGSPNGLNPVGAMRVLEELGQTIEDNGYADYTKLDADRRAEYEDAWEDFQYWAQLMANVFSKDVAGQEDQMEVEVQTGTDAEGEPVFKTKTFANPHGASTMSGTADLPDRPV